MGEIQPARALKLQARFNQERRKLLSGMDKKIERFAALGRAEGLRLEFDRALDTVFIQPGKAPRPSFLEPLGDNLYVEMDPHTLEIVGFEVHEFREVLASGKIANAAFGMLYPALLHYGAITLPPESEGPEVAAGDLYRALAFAS